MSRAQHVENPHNLIAMLDGRPAGMVSGVPTAEDGVAELISMWVSPAARGHGVGDLLIAAVQQWARRSPAQVLRLSVMRDNEPAIALYRRNGFADTDEQWDHDGAGRKLALVKKLTRP